MMRPVADAEIEQSRKMFELGDYRRAIHALRWCTSWDVPLPPWLAAEVLDAMMFYFKKGGAKGKRGRGGGHAKRLDASKKHMERYRIVAREIAKGCDKEEAYRRAHELLKGAQSQAEPRQMRDSYEKVDAELRAVLGEHRA